MSMTFSPTTALVVVDMQNDFGDPHGSLFVQEGNLIVANVNQHIADAQAAGSPVLYTQDWHPPETPHFVTGGGVWPVHCVRDTWGAELRSDLTVDGPVVRKGTGGEDGYSGFTMRDPESGAEQATELHTLLQERAVDAVVVVGLALDVCVKATADDAHRLGYQTTVLTDASRAVNINPDDGTNAVAAMTASGITVL